MMARSNISFWERSSSTVKRAATFASNGNCWSSRVQKAWIVCTLSPPGVSSAAANSARARARLPVSIRWTPMSASAASSAASSSAIQLRKPVEHARRHVGGGRLGEGDAQDARRIDPAGRAVEHQPDDALREHMGLARAGIGGDEHRARRVGGIRLPAPHRLGDLADAHGSTTSRPPESDHSLHAGEVVVGRRSDASTSRARASDRASPRPRTA